jgi:hypothetical protein
MYLNFQISIYFSIDQSFVCETRISKAAGTWEYNNRRKPALWGFWFTTPTHVGCFLKGGQGLHWGVAFYISMAH